MLVTVVETKYCSEDLQQPGGKTSEWGKQMRNIDKIRNGPNRMEKKDQINQEGNEEKNVKKEERKARDEERMSTNGKVMKEVYISPMYCFVHG